jgi:pyruvate formate lyase activating enzyme
MAQDHASSVVPTRHSYTGNVHDKEGESTYCHQLGRVVVGCDWFTLSDWNLSADGRCACCGTPCAGVFDGPPGAWGPRPMPVRLRDIA